MHALLQVARLGTAAALGTALALGLAGCGSLGLAASQAAEAEVDRLAAVAELAARAYESEADAGGVGRTDATGRAAADEVFRQAAESCATEVPISRSLKITQEDLEAAIRDLRMTPEYLCSTGTFSYELSAPSETEEFFASSLTMDYDYDVSLVPLYRAELEEAAAAAVAEAVDPDMSDVERALALHDWLVENCEYDQTLSRYSAYDAIVVGSATCQGYVQAYKMLLELAGVPCAYAESDAMEHSWNLVQIGGAWYHVDVTWDDPIIIGGGESRGVSRDHFLKSDGQMEALGYLDWTAPHAAPEDYPRSF